MATVRSDPSSPPTPRKSWQELARRAASESAPDDVDVRAFLRTRLASEPRGETAMSSGKPTLWDDLSALSGFNGLRFALCGGAALSVGLLIAGTLALREVQAIASLTSPLLTQL